jgi:hypothetical protein
MKVQRTASRAAQYKIAQLAAEIKILLDIILRSTLTAS